MNPENYVNRYNDVSEEIERSWNKIKKIVDEKRIEDIDHLRFAVTLLKQYAVRKQMLENMKDENKTFV